MSTFKSLPNVKYMLVVVALLVGAAFAVAIGAECEGTWEASSTLSCPTNSVCAEWDVGGTSQGSCCIAPEDLGTSHLEACEGPLL